MSFTVQKRKDEWEHHHTGCKTVGYGTTKANAETDWERKQTFLYGPNARLGETFSTNGLNGECMLRVEGSSFKGFGPTPEAARTDWERQTDALRRAKEQTIRMGWNYDDPRTLGYTIETDPPVLYDGEPCQVVRGPRTRYIKYPPCVPSLSVGMGSSEELLRADLIGYEADDKEFNVIIPKEWRVIARVEDWLQKNNYLPKTNKAMNTQPAAEQQLFKENDKKLTALNMLSREIQNAMIDIGRLEQITTPTSMSFAIGCGDYREVKLFDEEGYMIAREALNKVIAMKGKAIKRLQSKFNKQMAALPAVK